MSICHLGRVIYSHYTGMNMLQILLQILVQNITDFRAKLQIFRVEITDSVTQRLAALTLMLIYGYLIITCIKFLHAHWWIWRGFGCPDLPMIHICQYKYMFSAR